MSSDHVAIRTKEQCTAAIKESRSHPAHKKLYEFFDDYSYSNAKNIGFHIDYDTDKEQYYAYAFMDKGPQDCDTLNKLFEWRKSGGSGEIGHQGGGNKRFIYGHHSKRTDIIVELEENKYLHSFTKPDKLFDYSIQETNEHVFRSNSDTSAYINWAEEKDKDEIPPWFLNYSDEINNKLHFRPKYVIRMQLSQLENEYKTEYDYRSWNSFVNRIRMKNYTRNVYMINYNVCNYNKITNIDTMGYFEIDIDKEDVKEKQRQKPQKKTMILTDGIDLYVKSENDYYLDYNSKNKNPIKVDKILPNLQLFGYLYQYIIGSNKIKKYVAELNSNSNDKFSQGDFYGVWMVLNKKQIDCMPMSSMSLPDSKNNHIVGNGSAKFRWVICPKAENSILEKFIRTDTIKANTCFKDTFKIKKLIDTTMNIYKDEPASNSDEQEETPTEAESPSAQVKVSNNPQGAGYLLFIYKYNGELLLKYGYITDYKKNNTRLGQHRKKTSVQKVIKEFLEYDIKNNVNEGVKYVYNTPPIKEPKTFECLFHSHLERMNDEHPGKLTLFSSGRTDNEDREYFLCNDLDFLQTNIINPISRYYNIDVCK